MNRQGIILGAIVLAIAGTVLPIAIAWQIAWQRAVDAEQRQLNGIAERAIDRAILSFNEIGDALHRLDPLPPNMAACSPAHIARMRQITLSTRSVDEIGYLAGGRLLCTGWGRTATVIRQTPAQFVTPAGLEVVLRIAPGIDHGRPMMELRYGHHNALTDPVRFADIMLQDDIALAVATGDGHILGTLHAPDQDLISAMLSGAAAGLHRDDNQLIAVGERDGIKAIVMEDRGKVRERLRAEQLLLLPPGLLMAVLIVALVTWLSRRRLSLRGELAIAVRRREFIVHYQPLIALASGRCIGAEALVRWQRPDGNLVRPDLFIPLAEESGLILPITDQVVQATLTDLGALMEQDHGLHVAINLCADDIRSGRILGVIRAALAGTNVLPAQIWLEATERGFMDPDAARATLRAARADGHKIAVDDFGTGYSSLSYLQDLPLDALKIDKSFIDSIGTDAASSSVTPHIIDMARTLGLEIVAEGIETRLQADYLREKGVEYGQGWLFAKAMPAAEFAAFYRRCNDVAS